jgi:hypothetical protein
LKQPFDDSRHCVTREEPRLPAWHGQPPDSVEDIRDETQQRGSGGELESGVARAAGDARADLHQAQANGIERPFLLVAGECEPAEENHEVVCQGENRGETRMETGTPYAFPHVRDIMVCLRKDAAVSL